jgi:hypothetical protein
MLCKSFLGVLEREFFFYEIEKMSDRSFDYKNGKSKNIFSFGSILLLL